VLFVDPAGVACESALDAVVRGTVAVVLAAGEEDLLAEAIEAAERGFAVVSTRVVEGARSAPTLSGRDRRLLALVAEGASNGEVAEHLHCSTATVKRVITDLVRRLAVDGRPGLIAAARDLGIEKGSPN
jgi:DNA-binding NarL/FixJ family response regulator